MDNYAAYLDALRGDFVKLCRLRFLQPDGSTAFAVGNGPLGENGGVFIADGTVTMNWRNGVRRTATVKLENAGGDFSYNYNRVWFGTEIALDEGLVLPDGEEFYIQQGVFLVTGPQEALEPDGDTVTLNLSDKCANLNGELLGQLEGAYLVLKYDDRETERTDHILDGVNIFAPIVKLLADDRGNGLPFDATPPVFTDWYNGKTQILPDGETEALLTNVPYELRVDSADGTRWTVIEGLCEMLNAWVGYDESGALRVDASQDDITDADKPIAWNFRMDEAQILGAAYAPRPGDVYNDYIVEGALLDGDWQACGRAENYDDATDTPIQLIGRRTKRLVGVRYATDKQCADRAEWELKRAAVLRSAVSISCLQMFHLRGGMDLVTITRTDKPGSPVERHLVTGFQRPLVGTRPMTIDAVSVSDLPFASVTVGEIREPETVEMPTQNGTLIYNGAPQTPVWNGYDPDEEPLKLTIGGATVGTKAGEYIATFQPRHGYQWSDGTRQIREAPWSIGKAVLPTPYPAGTLSYTGREQGPEWVNYDRARMAISGDVTATETGTYTATFTVRDPENYEF